MDIAKYGIAIDARQVKDAEKALDGMGAAGARAEKSGDAVSRSFVTMAGEAAKAYGSLTLVNGVLVSSTSAAKEYTAAINGLASVARYSGQDIQATLGRATALTRDGLLSTSEAALALKNLLSRGFSTDQAVQMIERFKDSAAFGRQASLEFGQAVVSATEGIKNENSILVDNAGVTKNVSQMWKEYAAQIGVGVGELTQAQKRQAEYNGILAETEGQLGNAAIASDGLVGAQARMNKATKDAATAFGQLLTPAVTGAANAATMLLENAVNPTIFGMEALGVKAGETTAKVGLFFSFLSDPKRWSGGIAAWINSPEYKAQLAALEKLSDEMLTASAGRISGATGPVAPELGKDSGKRREDAKEAAKEAKERITDYQRLVESSRDRIAMLQAELTSETKLTEGEKYAAKMLADVRSGKLKLTAAERERLEAMASAIGQMSKYQAQQAEQAEGVKRLADEERKRNEELGRGVLQAEADLEALKIRTNLMMLGATATEDITQALLEAQLASEDFTTATYEEIDALERRIGIAREAAQVAREGRRYESQQRAAKDAAQNAAREWERASEQIAQSLTDNIMRGGKSAGELLQDYFRTLVLRPVIQGTVQSGLNAVGLGGGAGGLLQTGANLVGLSGVGLGSLGTMTSYGAAAATGGLLGGASQGAMLAAQTAEFGAAGAAATAEALGGVASSLGAVSAALGPIGIGLGVLAMGGLFDDEGDAMRTGNWQGGLGQATRSPDNQWFSDAEMGAALGRFSESLAKSEKGVITALELSAEQIDTINSDIEELVGKRYDFGMEHTDIPEATFAQISRDRFAEVFDEIGAGLGDIVRASGDSYQSVMQTVGALVQSADAFRYIDGNLSGLTATTIAAAGGIADFGNATAFYLGNFYTENERLALSMSELLPQFQALGYDHVPRTRDEFRLLVESLDLTSEAGQRARGELLGLADDVAAVTDASTVRARREEYTPTVWSAAPTRAAEEAQQAAAELARNRRILEIQIMELTGDAAGALAAQRADELESMDASLRPLQQRIYALDDERRITEARTAWQERLDVLTGARTQRQIDLTRDLAGVTDAATAATVRQVYALEAQMSAADSAMSALRRAADAEQERLKKARDEAEKNLATVTSVFDIVTEGARALRREVKTLDAMRLSDARAYIDMATALAQAGAMPDEKQLARAVDALAADSERGYTTLAEFEFAQLAQAAKLDKLGKLTGDQKSLAQKQLDAIDGQTTILEDQLDAAQRQIDALNGVNSSVLSVTAAIAALGYAVDAARQTQVAGGGGGPLARYSDAQISGAVDFVSTRAAAGDIGGIVTEAQRLGVTSAELAAVIQRAGYEGITQADVLGWTASHGMPSFATGVNAGILPADTMLQAHGGERITPAAFVDLERADREQTNALLARLVAANEALRTEMAQLKADMALTQRNTRRSADTLDNVTDGGDAMRVDVVATV